MWREWAVTLHLYQHPWTVLRPCQTRSGVTVAAEACQVCDITSPSITVQRGNASWAAMWHSRKEGRARDNIPGCSPLFVTWEDLNLEMFRHHHLFYLYQWGFNILEHVSLPILFYPRGGYCPFSLLRFLNHCYFFIIYIFIELLIIKKSK